MSRVTDPVADRDAVLVAAARTPIGRAHKGSLVDVRPDDLAGFAIDAALRRVPGLDRGAVEDVILGCGFPERKLGMNVGRRAALLAPLPVTVPGTTVNRFCASSLQAIRMAYHAIAVGEGDVFVAGGVESISQVDGYPRDDDRNPRLGPEAGDLPDVYVRMGITAENVADRYDVSREEMDRFAQRSQQRAVDARAAGFFDAEIEPYPVDADHVFAQDECPRPTSTYEALAGLKPAFREGGSVTAGNACPLNDGAAAVVVMSAARARELGIEPLARVLGSAVSGVDPTLMGVGPIEAIRRVFAATGVDIADVDVMELNEAFAAQVIPVCREVGIDPFDDRVNPQGGAIALGHPFGMTGARIMCTLLNGLAAKDGEIGLETMCVGGGQGMAMLVQRL